MKRVIAALAILVTLTFCLWMYTSSVLRTQVEALGTLLEIMEQEEILSAKIKVVDPGSPTDCIEVTVTADSGTPEEEAASLRAKIEAAYTEFGRCPN